jgi:orotidine-5'-phosphate decarboxylase
MAAEHFADRLFDAVQRKRSQLVVGLDPRIPQLPPAVLDEAVREHGRGVQAAASAIVQFNRGVLDAVSDAAVAVKIQIAFYECLGREGMTAYARTIEDARARGLIVIADVKRNDIGNTAEAYALAHLAGPAPDEWPVPPDFHGDAVTVNPLLGSDGVKPFIVRAVAGGCGVFVLVRTSNPSSREIQDLDCGGMPLHVRIAEMVERWGSENVGRSGYSMLGAVVGATFPGHLRTLREVMPHAPLLVPGFGAQGGDVGDVKGAFDPAGSGAIVVSARAIIFAWEREPYASKWGAGKWQDAVRAAAEDTRAAIWKATHRRRAP